MVAQVKYIRSRESHVARVNERRAGFAAGKAQAKAQRVAALVADATRMMGERAVAHANGELLSTFEAACVCAGRVIKPGSARGVMKRVVAGVKVPRGDKLPGGPVVLKIDPIFTIAGPRYRTVECEFFAREFDRLSRLAAGLRQGRSQREDTGGTPVPLKPVPPDTEQSSESCGREGEIDRTAGKVGRAGQRPPEPVARA